MAETRHSPRVIAHGRRGEGPKASPILFVSHDASATGAPFLLLHLLRWLRENTPLAFDVALKLPGALQQSFEAIAPTAVLNNPGGPLGILYNNYPNWVKPHYDRNRMRRTFGTDRFALIYSNTLVNGDLLRHLPQDCPVITHVHELDYVLDRFSTPSDVRYALERSSLVLAGSRAVAANLIERHGVRSDKVEVVYEFIPVSQLDPGGLAERGRQTRARLQISEHAFVIGAAGTVSWRKGHDLFVMLASRMADMRSADEVHLVWIGDPVERKISGEIAHDLAKLGIGSCVHFVGHQANYLEYMAMFDAFCLMSREDPFPLVVLEAAALSTPVLCFDGAGGAPEFVADDCGFVVPYLDVYAMTARLEQLRNDRALRERIGRSGREKVVEAHDVNVIAPRIERILVDFTSRVPAATSA
jgi:glycosyltransferase involved in cell wall biosynthesis